MPDYIAIGDIHGLDDTLAALLARLPAEGTLVFLGDYLDRGPAVKDVLERLMALAQTRPCVFLRGNHEDMALKALAGDVEALGTWRMNGGDTTLASYGGEIPPEHLSFLERTRFYYETPQYIFVHAGLPPGRRPEDVDDPEILCWIRRPFLDSQYHWGKLVIHGHTPTPNRMPDIHVNRINIDTGAIYGGSLTALLLPELTFVTAPGHRP